MEQLDGFRYVAIVHIFLERVLLKLYLTAKRTSVQHTEDARLNTVVDGFLDALCRSMVVGNQPATKLQWFLTRPSVSVLKLLLVVVETG